MMGSVSGKHDARGIEKRDGRRREKARPDEILPQQRIVHRVRSARATLQRAS